MRWSGSFVPAGGLPHHQGEGEGGRDGRRWMKPIEIAGSGRSSDSPLSQCLNRVIHFQIFYGIVSSMEEKSKFFFSL